MTLTIRNSPRTVLLAALLTALPMTAMATIVVPMSVETMAKKSVLVVRATVLDANCEWDRSNKHIFTYTRLKAVEALRGQLSPGKLFRIRTLGGEIGEIGMAVAGTAKFKPGEEVVVFVRVDPYDAADYQVVGMSQGKFVVQKDEKGEDLVVPNVNGLEFARRDIRGAMQITGQAVENKNGISLNAFKKRVDTVAGSVSPTLKKTPSTGDTNR